MNRFEEMTAKIEKTLGDDFVDMLKMHFPDDSWRNNFLIRCFDYYVFVSSDNKPQDRNGWRRASWKWLTTAMKESPPSLEKKPPYHKLYEPSSSSSSDKKISFESYDVMGKFSEALEKMKTVDDVVKGDE